MTFLMLGIEPTKRIELPLWGNVILLLVVAILFAIIIRDIICVCRLNKDKKGTK